MVEMRPESSADDTEATRGAGAFARFRVGLRRDQKAEWLTWLSRAVLFLVLGSYVVAFARANDGMLLDPDLDVDDIDVPTPSSNDVVAKKSGTSAASAGRAARNETEGATTRAGGARKPSSGRA